MGGSASILQTSSIPNRIDQQTFAQYASEFFNMIKNLEEEPVTELDPESGEKTTTNPIRDGRISKAVFMELMEVAPCLLYQKVQRKFIDSNSEQTRDLISKYKNTGIMNPIRIMSNWLSGGTLLHKFVSDPIMLATLIDSGVEDLSLLASEQAQIESEERKRKNLASATGDLLQSLILERSMRRGGSGTGIGVAVPRRSGEFVSASFSALKQGNVPAFNMLLKLWNGSNFIFSGLYDEKGRTIIEAAVDCGSCEMLSYVLNLIPSFCSEHPPEGDFTSGEGEGLGGGGAEGSGGLGGGGEEGRDKVRELEEDDDEDLDKERSDGRDRDSQTNIRFEARSLRRGERQLSIYFNTLRGQLIVIRAMRNFAAGTISEACVDALLSHILINKFLSRSGVDPFNGENALHKAVALSKRKWIKVLVDAGVGVYYRNKANQTPLDLCGDNHKLRSYLEKCVEFKRFLDQQQAEEEREAEEGEGD